MGDRHPSNLMLDRYSGKLLHIDFGDCFEASMNRCGTVDGSYGLPYEARSCQGTIILIHMHLLCPLIDNTFLTTQGEVSREDPVPLDAHDGQGDGGEDYMGLSGLQGDILIKASFGFLFEREI